jgi:hypothetical protein
MRTIRSSIVTPLAGLFVWSAVLAAQGNSAIAGNWVLDEARSQTGRGRAGGPGPTQMIVKVAPAEVVVVTDTGVNRARETATLKLDGGEHEVPGPLSWNSVAKAAWEGDKLRVTIARIIEGPNGPIRIEMNDLYSVENDVLTIERTQGPQTWKSVFTRR